MSRPLRIEFPGAVYHVTSRGDRREPIYLDDVDRQLFLRSVSQATHRFNAQILSYCLMGNHYHLVVHTREANLSMLMRHVNGTYTQSFNRRHDKVGHVFQGRFKAILVDRDAYLLTLCRYVEMNPVRAKLIHAVREWPWSSYRAHVGEVESPEWLDTAGLHGYLLGRDAKNESDHHRAAKQYAGLFVNAAPVDVWAEGLRQQIFLGDEAFVERMQALMGEKSGRDRNIPKAQRTAKRTLEAWISQASSREEGMYRAYTEGAITMSAMAAALDLSVSRISRLIAAYEKQTKKLSESTRNKAKGKT